MIRPFNFQHARIILGSSSRSRRLIMDELSREHKFTYEVLTADIDEKMIRHPDPHQLVTQLARAKAEAIVTKLRAAEGPSPSGYLLTCDQVVVHEGRILEKPESEAEARRFIAGYGRSPASTVGSVLVTHLDSGRSVGGVDVCQIEFKPLPDSVVDALIAEGAVMACAGGLMVEHPLVVPFLIKIQGSQDGVMGLSKALVLRLLAQAQADAAVS